MKRIIIILGLLGFAGIVVAANAPGARLARGYIFRGNSSGVAEVYDANGNGQILVGDGTDLASVSVSGDVALTSAGAATVTDFTIASEARGDILRRGASAWERVACKATGTFVGGDVTDVVCQTMGGDATLNSAGALNVTDVTVGSGATGDILYKSSATALARLAKGNGGYTLTMKADGTLPVWDSGKIVKAGFSSMTAADDPMFYESDGTVAPGTTGARNIMYLPEGTKLNYWVLGAGQTILGPVGATSGIDIGCDQTENDGLEITSNAWEADGRPFSVGYNAAFYFLVTINIADVSGVDDLFIGFRQVGGDAGLEAVNTAMTGYYTYFGLGADTVANPMALKVIEELNGAAGASTDTTDTIADGVDLQVKVLVDAAGVATIQHDADTPGTLEAPDTTSTFTFDDGDQLMPMVRYLHAVAPVGGAILIKKWEVGFQ